MDTQWQIVDNTEAQRFETRVDGQLCVLDYRRSGSVLHIDHVGVPSPVEGRGIASALTGATLQSVRQRGLHVIAHCSYAAAWLRRHPEYADLIRH